LVLGLSLAANLQNADAQGTPNPRVASSGGDASSSELDTAIKVAQSALATARKITDYEATFTKRELVRRNMIFHTMKVKVRHRPFSVYLRFGGQHDGREVLYVQGLNDGNILAHESGIKSLVGTISLEPNSPRALEESRYPITRMGIVNMVQSVIDQWQKETQYKDVSLKYYPKAKLGKMQCKVIETAHKSAKPGVQFQTTRLYIDRKTNLPVRVEQFAFSSRSDTQGPLVEEYTYSEIQPNRGLGNFDFDPRNQAYAF